MNIKKFKKFSEGLNKIDLDTLNDMCLELSDDGFIGYFNGEFDGVKVSILPRHNYYIIIRRHHDKPFKFYEIKDAVYRIKDYLGDNLNEFKYITNDAGEFAYEYKLKELKDEKLNDDISIVQAEIAFRIYNI